ncbi:recombinase family protein [Belnapia rosea]|uniref:recombinase family protein n=1 Tax=Belnapia rosea TaxID=938405 RepID=UPI00210B824B|nr:recombinase family protein [Belnapia rosea]
MKSKAKVTKEAAPAAAYLRTSSAANIGGDSDHRQRAAIRAYAERAGLVMRAEFYDGATSGADPVETRRGFMDMLAWAAANGVAVVLVEDASRFARSLVAQELGLAMLARRGIRVITANGDDLTNTTDPSRVMMRQIGGAFAEYEKARLVVKLRGARDRASAAAGRRVEGRKGHSETNPAMLKEARRLARRNPVTGKRRSLREIGAELHRLGFTTSAGTAFGPSQVQRFLGAA